MTDLNTLVFADLERELQATRRVLERIPDEHFTWKPHERSTPIGELGLHIAGVTTLLEQVATRDEIDFASAPAPPSASSTREVLEIFDAGAASVRERIEKATPAELAGTITLRSGDYVIMTAPRLLAVRSFGLSHIAHHRGQLTVYLRLLDVPVPSVYGPTADEG
jgi:uncharacterized damage-inducible protein DinB